MYHFPDENLRRAPLHEDLDEEVHYTPCTAAYEEGISIPDVYSSEHKSLGLSDDEFERLYDLLPHELDPDHQLLGLPNQIQDEMQTECQFAANAVDCYDPQAKVAAIHLMEGASQWRLPFRCGSDDNLNWMWDDAGRLFFWIRESDLAARNFDDVWMVLQC